MYQNFESLMPNCQSSVGDLFMLRNQYWEEESFVNSRRGPPKEFFLLWVLLLMGISLAVGISLRRRRHGMKETRAILKAIQANPALAAQGN